MKAIRSVQSTVYPDGYVPVTDKSIIFWFSPFITWLQYIKTNKCQQ